MTTKRDTCSRNAISCAYWNCDNCDYYIKQVPKPKPACSQTEQPDTITTLQSTLSMIHQQICTLTDEEAEAKDLMSALTQQYYKIRVARKSLIREASDVDLRLAKLDGRWKDYTITSRSKDSRSASPQSTAKKILSGMSKTEIQDLLNEMGEEST